MKHLYFTLINLFRNGLIAFILFSICISSAQAQIRGTIFRDFDLNGVRSDTLPIETGIAGVLVRAFVEASKTPIQTITDAAGTFTFSGVDIPAGKQVRIEFGNLPSGYYNGPYGVNSGTSVQFVKAPASNVNLGINYPSDYCQPTGVRLAVPCYINGNSQTITDADGNPVPDDRQAARGDALVGLAYDANGVAGASNFPPDHLATTGQVGAIWALAYQRRTKKLFSAAVVKRHMSFGPLGTGGIYVTDMATGTTSNFIDLKTIGIDTGDDPHSGLFGDKTQASADAGSMGAMGRLSIGGMDMSDDDKTLYLINLKDRALYSVFLNAPAQAPTATDVKSWPIPDPGCSNGDFRPWAVKVYHGNVYVGVVCSAETSQQQSDLRATIYRFDPASNTFETVLSFPLDFRRGVADATYDPAFPNQACTQYDHWLPWTDAWPAPCGQGANPYFVMYPQPIVSDLEFDDDGSMIIGFLDRFGHLAGVANHDPQGNGFYDGFTGGDILKAFNNNGTFVLENNGQAGNRTGSGVGNNEGPGGGEFYGQDNWFFIDHYGHSEVANGALALVPGYNEIVTSAFDPIENIFQSGGLKVFNNYTGQSNRNFVLYTNNPGSFGKASGLGDVKALCDPAPVEIGNRVWYDDNRDGIQDAYEPGIDGLVLTLHDMEANGVQIATQTTHNGGQYYFNNTTVPGGLQFGHRYEIRMDTAQLSQLDLSVPNATSGGRIAARAAGARKAIMSRSYRLSPADRSDFQDSDLRDSDAQLNGSYAFMAVTTMDAGQNDFTHDLSVYSCPALTAERDTIRLCAGATVDSVAAQGYYLSRADSIRFVLFSSPQSGTAMYANSGVVLGTVKPDASNRAVMYNPLINTSTGSAAGQNQYVYAIIYPTPEDPACRQSGYTVLQIKPSLTVTATGGPLTCTATTVTLTGKAQNYDGTEAAGVSYAWHGPDSFSSTVQNPLVNQPGTYTLTATDSNCSASLVNTTAEVLADTAKPALMATGGTLPCAGCTINLHAEAPGAILSWTGPNGFSGSETDPEVQDPGEYTILATGTNGCLTVVRVVVWPYIDPCLNARSACLPVLMVRIKR